MEFKSAGDVFKDKNRFADEMKRFVIDEAARFTTTGNNEAASASIDEFAEKGVRFSIEKHKRNIKEQKQILKEIELKVKDQKKDKSGKSESINQSEVELPDGVSSSPSSQEATSSNNGGSESKEKSDSGHQAQEKEKELDKKKENAKKEKNKETKKAGAKTAVAQMLRAKKELSNDLVGNKVTGDALKDGNTGLVHMLTEALNPMTYLRKLVAYVGMVIAPYILAFFAIAAVVMIIVMFLFSVLEPLAEVGEAISNFLSFFTTSEEIVNDEQSEDEINAIIDSISSMDDTQKSVVIYALSKVGYPYSQEDRASGDAYDCSSLAYYAWEQAGVDVSYGSGYPPSAAEMARMLNEDGKALTTMDLQPGDLVFYGGDGNGRYMGIYHVAIYVGNGMCVEALNTSYGVVYQALRSENTIMVCRPGS